MEKLLYILILVPFCAIISRSSASVDAVLEPFIYSENFESRTLRAWASYPLWQDTAYDPNFRINEMVSGDPNISVVQKVTPYTNVDNYAGAQKLFDIYLVPGSEITFRYYLKSHLSSEFFKVRLAAGQEGKVDYTIFNPPLNRWEWITVTFNDFIRENPRLAGKDRIKVNALAILVKVPNADPDMPFYLGFDDVTVKGARAMEFQFAEPTVYKLSEWKPYIPKKPYHRGDTFNLNGKWLLDAERVELSLVSFTDHTETFLTRDLNKTGDMWSLKSLKLTYPEGLYLGILRAFNGKKILSETEFTMHIAPENVRGKHPRLWFDSEKKQLLIKRLKSDKFRKVYDDIAKNAESQRKRLSIESIIYDLDQFPDETWLPTWSAWGSHIYPTGPAMFWNALAYAFHGDRTAGEYAIDVLIKLAEFDNWTHPWQTKRGRFSEHRSGSWSHNLSLAYDLTYDLMTENERILIRKAFMNNVVMGVHRTYVVNNNVTCNTSNWIAHVAGGSLMMQAAMFDDGPDVEMLEPYYTGAALKLYDFIQKTIDPDGAWGEGLGYNNYSFRTMSQSLPSIENVFNIDMSKPLLGTYKEYIWAGLINDRRYFYFGDTGGNLNPIPNWAWLLEKYKDPLLVWYYNFLKYEDYVSNTRESIQSYMSTVEEEQTLMDVLYETENIPLENPFKKNPVKVFRGVGTTVFKSGWNSDDFVFVMRTGPFYNHQHIDQGSFWLADHGSIFIEERHGSTYYDDPLYQPWYTQPVAHSTILIDGNHQSQRVGDHLNFAEGFEDYAFIDHFLDGEEAAFSSGDIGRLYWGKVKSLKRNVLFLKPRTILMLDTVIPDGQDVDVTLLYQTLHLKDITPDSNVSRITKNGNILNIKHLFPEYIQTKSVETPHYLNTLRDEKPLEKEGMLTVTARTQGIPLVMANLLTTTTGNDINVITQSGKGHISGTIQGKEFAFTTRLNSLYKVSNFATDALALTWDNSRIFAAQCNVLRRNGSIVFESESPVTCEVTMEGFTYYLSVESEVKLGVPSKPQSIIVNGVKVTEFRYDAEHQTVILLLPKGEGTVEFK